MKNFAVLDAIDNNDKYMYICLLCYEKPGK